MDFPFPGSPGSPGLPALTWLLWLLLAPAVPAIRGLLSLAVAALLYRELDERGVETPAAAASIRRICFSLLGGAVFFGLSANWVPEERAAGPGRGFQAYVQGV